MSFFSRKFSLARGNFLTIGLNGLQPEIRVAHPFKTTLVLSLPKLHMLQNATATLLTSDGVHLSSTFDDYDQRVVRHCMPGDEGKLLFQREIIMQAQPLDPSDNIRTIFTLESVSVQAFLRFLPSVIAIADNIASQQPSLALAYNIVGIEVKRLCQANRYPSTHEYFPHLMQLLHQYTSISGLVKAFKENFVGELTVSAYELFKVVIFQYEYLYANLFSAEM